MAPKKAKFNRITKVDGYKLVPANKTAERKLSNHLNDIIRRNK